MTKIELSCGFEAEVDEQVINDYRFLRLYKKLARASKEESILYFDDMLEYIFGVEQAEAIIEHIAEQNGYVDYQQVDDTLTEAFNILNGLNEDTKK